MVGILLSYFGRFGQGDSRTCKAGQAGPLLGLLIFRAGQPTPPKVPPQNPRNNGLIRPDEGTRMVNKPLIRPYYWGGTFGGVWLTSHKYELNGRKS